MKPKQRLIILFLATSSAGLAAAPASAAMLGSAHASQKALYIVAFALSAVALGLAGGLAALIRRRREPRGTEGSPASTAPATQGEPRGTAQPAAPEGETHVIKLPDSVDRATESQHREASSPASMERDLYVLAMIPGPAWDTSRSLEEQDEWVEHSAYINQLIANGFVRLGGPVQSDEQVVLVVHATDEREINAILAEDPWVSTGVLRIGDVHPWTR